MAEKSYYGVGKPGPGQMRLFNPGDYPSPQDRPPDIRKPSQFSSPFATNPSTPSVSNEAEAYLKRRADLDRLIGAAGMAEDFENIIHGATEGLRPPSNRANHPNRQVGPSREVLAAPYGVKPVAAIMKGPRDSGGTQIPFRELSIPSGIGVYTGPRQLTLVREQVRGNGYKQHAQFGDR